LRHCTKSRNDAGSVPDGVIGIFHTGHTLVLDSTQPHNSNEYQGYFLGVKGGRCIGLRTLPPPGAECLEIGDRQPTGTLWACNNPLLGSLFLYINCSHGARTYTHIHVYVCVCVCIYIYICVRARARAHTHTHTHIRFSSYSDQSTSGTSQVWRFDSLKTQLPDRLLCFSLARPSSSSESIGGCFCGVKVFVVDCDNWVRSVGLI
jgi:hypothetical protein